MKELLLAITLFTCGCAFGTVSAQPFSSLEERMSAADFEAAGLDKLSPEELERLNAWLRSHTAAQAQGSYPPAGDRIGFRDPGPTGTVVSQIDGEFTGWSGRTVFRLKNGQVGQQIDSDARLGGVRLDSPGVRIEQGLFGSWLLQVDGYNSQVRVKRLQ